MTGSNTIPDPYLYRLLGGAAGFLGIISALHSWHLAASRIPTWRTVLADFGTAVPPATQLAFRLAWLPMCISLLMVVAGAASAIRPHRALLAVTIVLSLLSVSSLLLADHAIDTTVWGLMQGLSRN